MYKAIGGDQQEYGPASAEELRQWIAEGRLSGESLVRAEGQTEWQPLKRFSEFAEALQAQARLFSRTPPPLTNAAGKALPDADEAARPVQIGRCLSRSGRLVGNNFGLLVGASTMVWLLSFLCQGTPFVGPILYLLLDGVLFGGLYLVFLKRIRGQETAISEVFGALGPGFGQLMLVGFLTSFLSSLGVFFCVAPWLYLIVAWVFAIPLVADKRLEFWSAMERSRRVVTRVWLPMALLLFLAFLPVVLMYTYMWIKMMLVAYPEFEALRAAGPPDMKHIMEMSLHVEKALAPLVMVHKLVLLINLPFAAGAIMYAYEDLFGNRGASDS